MGSIHVDAAIRAAKEWDADPRTVTIIPTCLAGLRTGRWDRDYLEAIGQLQWGGPSKWPRHQVAAFAIMHQYLMTGLAAEAGIYLGVTPYPDADRESNALALEDLPKPFTADIDKTQRNADQDGWLEWHEPIIVTRSVGVAYYRSTEEAPAPLTMRQLIPAGSVPLEIGTTLPSRTAMHVYADRGVARWPYDAVKIRLFVSSKFPRPMFPSILDRLDI